MNGTIGIPPALAVIESFTRFVSMSINSFSRVVVVSPSSKGSVAFLDPIYVLVA